MYSNSLLVCIFIFLVYQSNIDKKYNSKILYDPFLYATKNNDQIVNLQTQFKFTIKEQEIFNLIIFLLKLSNDEHVNLPYINTPCTFENIINILNS